MKKEIKLESLNAIFNPSSIAIIGVSDESSKLGYQALKAMILGGFKKPLYPIHKSLSRVMGLKIFSSLEDVPCNVDLAVIAVSASNVLPIIEDCVIHGVRGAVIFASGFKEKDETGLLWQSEIATIANKANLGIIGPNTAGIINTYSNLNATFFAGLPLKRGNMSYISQSGGVSQLIVNQVIDMNLGFSKIVGVGNRCNMDFVDILEYLRLDPETKAIGIFIEGIDNPRQLISVARDTVKEKPIVAYKAARTRSGPRVAYSHTGSLAGTYHLYKAAFKSVKISEVNSVGELVDTVYALSTMKFKPKGNRILIITHTSGPSIIALDTLEENDMPLASLKDSIIQKIFSLMPSGAPLSHNPLDMTGAAWADPYMYNKILGIAATDESVDAILLLYTSQYDIFVEGQWQKAAAKCLSYEKIVVVCLAYPYTKFAEAKKGLDQIGVPTFPTPERAAKALVNILKYGQVKSFRKGS